MRRRRWCTMLTYKAIWSLKNWILTKKGLI
jgi:hypothetical protein